MTTRARATANIIPTVDAKGDLLVGTASNALDNLTAGANGTYLRANSSATTGLEWAAVEALPSQTSQAGRYLTTNGSSPAWSQVWEDDQVVLAGQVFG